MKALILTALICGLPLMAHAQDWRPYFSEENNGETVCAGGIDGLRCNGGYCDNISLACKAGAIGAAAGGWSPWFSEERPNNIFRCQRGTVATGMRCDGGNCDNLSVRCDPVPDKVLSDCRTTGFISEESPNDSAFFGSDRVLVGVECRGSNCDNKRLEHCAVADRVAEIGQPEAGWEIVISGGQTVSVDVKESVSLTRSTSDSWSEETGRSLSLKINAGVGIGDLKLGAETGATLSSTHGRAAQLARTVDRSYEASCGHEIDMVAYELHAVW